MVLGNLLVDDIVMPDGRTLMGEAGGAMLYASLGAQLWDVRVGLVTVAGTDYPQATLDALAARNVDLTGVRALGRPGVRTWLLYEPRLRRVIHHVGCPSHLEVSPALADIPDSYAGARAVHLAPMPLDRQRALAEGLAARTILTAAASPRPFVSVDPHEPVDERSLPAWRPVLDAADAFFPGADELRDPVHHAAFDDRSAFSRLRFVALKRGAEGGRLLDRVSGVERAWRARATRVVDTTGAGDAFAGGFLAGWLTHGDPGRALEQGVVSASFAIEDWGARGVLAATADAARERRRDWFGG